MPHPRSQGRALDAGLFGVDLPGMEIDDRRSPVPLVHLPDRPARKAIGQQTEEAAAPRRQRPAREPRGGHGQFDQRRSEEHTSELQSLMRISYAVFCLKKKKKTKNYTQKKTTPY